MLLKELHISNCRKIRQASVFFHGPGTQVIEGANMSGKSTVAQAIALTMNGPSAFTPGMISKGEDEAEIVAITDDGLKVRTILSKTVRQTAQKYDEGLRRHINVSGGVRAFLDSLCSGLEQPWSLRDSTDAEIAEALMERSGATEKLKTLDMRLSGLETLRTEIGRDRKKLGEPGAAPEKAERPAPADDIKAEREKARAHLAWRQRLFAEASESLRKDCFFADMAGLEAFRKASDDAFRYVTESIATRDGLDGKAYAQADVDALDARLAARHDLAEKARAWEEHSARQAERDELDKKYAGLTAEIEGLRGERKKVLSEMDLGVPGLEIGDDGMLYHKGILRGVTKSNKTSNWSTAESVRVFFGLGARFAGEMKVLVADNAESLDKKTTDAISRWAEEAGFLVILLRVAESPAELEDGVIYLREGEALTK